MRSEQLSNLRVHDEIWIGRNEFIARVKNGHQGQKNSTTCSAGDDRGKIFICRGPPRSKIMFKALTNRGQQLRNSLRDGVAVFIFSNGRDGRFLHCFGHRKIRLSNGQIDWILHLGSKVKNLANA